MRDASYGGSIQALSRFGAASLLNFTYIYLYIPHEIPQLDLLLNPPKEAYRTLDERM